MTAVHATAHDPVAAFYELPSSTNPGGKVRSSFAAAALQQRPAPKKLATATSPRRPASASPRRPTSAVARQTAAAAGGRSAIAVAQNMENERKENHLLIDTFNVHAGSLPKRTKNGEARPVPHDTCPWRTAASTGCEKPAGDLHTCDLQAAARKRFDLRGQRPASARAAVQRPVSACAGTARPPSAAATGTAVAVVGTAVTRQQFLLQCVEQGHSTDQIERLLQQFDIGSPAGERSQKQDLPQDARPMPQTTLVPKCMLREQRALQTQTPVVKPYRHGNDPEQLHNAFVNAQKSFEAIKGICEMGNGHFLSHEVPMHHTNTQPHSLMAKRAQTLKTPSVKLRSHDTVVCRNAYVAARTNASDIKTRDRTGNKIF
eukprot:TRINITY_DN7104_c0_g1_i1.p1 TRINITY_DN7104_c0_g1~~TRINITY_DN7104_c0_g1_i1.p1  ORF type:complete len:374 (+),score=67.12 TRINITY_DN7104_c0_g1_i1:79-1200(+)